MAANGLPRFVRSPLRPPPADMFYSCRNPPPPAALVVHELPSLGPPVSMTNFETAIRARLPSTQADTLCALATDPARLHELPGHAAHGSVAAVIHDRGGVGVYHGSRREC